MRGGVSPSVMIGIVVLALAGAPALAAGAGASVETTDAGPDHPLGSADAGIAAQTDEFEAVLQEQPDAETTIVRVRLRANGTAEWSIQYRTRLETESDVAEYERFQESFRENKSEYLGPFRDRMTGVVSGADDRLGREMAATGFEATTSVQEVPQRWGVVTYRFTWEGFAGVEGDRVVVGDVFDDGYYVPEGTVLEVTAPEGYAVAEAAPTPDESSEQTVEWVGREDFAPGQPRVVTEPAGTADGADGDSAEGGDGSADGDDAGGGDGTGSTLPWLLAALLAVGLVGGALVARREGVLDGEGDDDGDATGDEPIVTDDERVLALLREHGGRVKQQRIVDEFGWSESKTSRVVGRLDEEGTVRKTRIGRENVVELPEDEP